MGTRGLVLASFDTPASLADVHVPALTDDQILIDVRASSVNAFDWKVADGVLRHAFEYEFPVTIGRDYAGVVTAVGADVTRVKVGDTVFGYLGGQRLRRGAFAEQLWLAEDECFAIKPDELTFEQAAALPLSGVVAMRMVKAVEPADSDVVVIIGAPGGVGSLATQLAAARGATVVATGPSADRDYLRGLGASEVVPPGEGLVEAIRALYPDGVDGWIDVVHSREQLTPLLDLLRPGGRVASAHRSADDADLEPRGLIGTNVNSAPDRGLLEELARMVVAGELAVPIEKSYPLDDVVEALTAARDTHTRGKSVVVVS